MLQLLKNVKKPFDPSGGFYVILLTNRQTNADKTTSLAQVVTSDQGRYQKPLVSLSEAIIYPRWSEGHQVVRLPVQEPR